MRPSEEGPSRHIKYLASIVTKTDNARDESEDAIMSESLDTSQIKASITPAVGHATGDAASSEVDDEESESELSSHDNGSPGSPVNAALPIRSALPPTSPRALRLSKKARREKHQLEAEKAKSKRIVKLEKMQEAAAYLAKRWGPDPTQYLPVQAQYPGTKKRALVLWPNGVVEQLANMAKLTSNADERKLAMSCLVDVMRYKVELYEPDIMTALRSFKILTGKNKRDEGGDEYVPLKASDEHEEILKMDVDTLRVELLKARTELLKARAQLKRIEG
ncbi:hypothetical protein UCDDS831_g08662 [Diplodia seriata]|uniref:Uncharacterized protein n=1 Tax=Diplodia seriata TaxID=420778 RepID=A0A0G2DS60_9PEZI|nr:hypothetical protein UCDDS831_g08662 [Diplodia seriata]